MDLLASLQGGELAALAAGLAVGGIVSGILAGVFGIGGGAIIVPVLAELFRHLSVPDEFQMQLAVGTSLAIIIPTTLRSFAGHRARGSTDPEALKAWLVPAAVGAMTGAGIAAVVSSDAMKAVFAVFALTMSANLLFGRDDWRLSETLPGRVVTGLAGFLIATLSALIGIGGGAPAVLFLTLHGRSIRVALGTSAGLGAVVAVPGALGYVLAGLPHLSELPPLSVGYVSLIGFAVMAPISVLVAPLGVRLAHGLTSRQLRAGFGCFLGFVALRFIFDLAT